MDEGTDRTDNRVSVWMKEQTEQTTGLGVDEGTDRTDNRVRCG